MSRKTKFVGLIILIQTGCITAGVWLHHACLRGSVRDTLLGQSVDRMAEEVQRLSGAFAEPGPTPGPRGDEASEAIHSADRFRALGGAGLSPDSGVMIVDLHWLVRWSTDAATAPPRVPPLAVGQRISWTPQPGSPSQDGSGSMVLADGVHFAVARPLSNSRGYLLVHQSEASLEASVSAVLSGLVGVSWMSMLWMSALLGVCSFILIGRFHNESERERLRSLNDAARQRRDLIRTRDAVIVGLAKLTESRDPETGDHLERISLFATTLATALMRHPDFMADIDPSFIRLIGISAALHDIGKVGVEDRILLKPGRLTPAERVEMERHARIGGECLREIERRLGRSNFLQMARDIAFSHHERWDGSGYPAGIRGEQIPLAARIVAICDVYDALSSRRVYKEPMPHEKCVAVLQEGGGTQFDPRMVDVWLAVASKFREIADRHASSRTRTFGDQTADERCEAPPQGEEKASGPPPTLCVSASGD